MIEEGGLESLVPPVRYGLQDAIPIVVRGAHDQRYLIPDLSSVRASVEQMVHGFLCLST